MEDRSNSRPADAGASASALAYMAASSILFALMNVFARLASSSASWASVGAVRAFIGAGVALAVARARGSSLGVTDKRTLFWRSLFGVLAMTSTFYVLSSRSLALADAVTLFNLAPVFLSLLAPLVLRERTSGATAIAIAISLAGVVLVVRPTFLFTDEGVRSGAGAATTATIVVAVLAALFTALAMMMLRRVGQRESAEAVALHYALAAGVTMTVIAAFDPRLPTVEGLGYMGLAGLCGGFGQLTLTRAYTLEAAARVSGMGYLSVVMSALLGAIALGERPLPLAIAGMGLVIAGGLVVTFVRPKPTRSNLTP